MILWFTDVDLITGQINESLILKVKFYFKENLCIVLIKKKKSLLWHLQDGHITPRIIQCD